MSKRRLDPRERLYADALRRLKDAGLRPTRQRLALSKLLFDGGDRHVTVEELHRDVTGQGIKVSLTTIYNTLNQFTDSGLLREVVVAPGRSYFDTNVEDHHHFFYEDDGALQDIPGDQIALATLPAAPADAEVARVDVIVRLRRANENNSQ
ncbi:MAG: transcriptional repressor [Rhodospirillaceae bacterium]|nr:transcriptional repressor [Rhodospirillaceae bacterium]|tara:strand:+ start:2896 stop:3348 length:453 start_codon:yes stop_codon:yes gene_type:complete